MIRTCIKGVLAVLSFVSLAAFVGCSSSSDSNADKDAATDSADVADQDSAVKDVSEASTDDAAASDVGSDASGDVAADVENDTSPDGTNDVNVDAEPDASSEGGGSSELTTGISGCFGFASGEERPDDYCRAEVVTAQYDEDIGRLVVQNSRVKSNCCGQ